MLCPFSMSTASVVAAEMANATPEPIWKAVLSCIEISESFQKWMGKETYHPTTETFHIDRDTSQDCCTSRDKDEGDSSNADQGSGKSVDPAWQLLAGSLQVERCTHTNFRWM